MTEEKLKLILEAMQGINHLEWKKLRHCIDICFSADISATTNKLPLADVDKIAETYLREFQ